MCSDVHGVVSFVNVVNGMPRTADKRSHTLYVERFDPATSVRYRRTNSTCLFLESPLGYPLAPATPRGFQKGILSRDEICSSFHHFRVCSYHPSVPGAQESEVLTVPQAVEQFGSVLDDEGLTLVVIHLNDKSVEALFSTAPNMRALQLQAKDATMFFVQGTNATSETVAPALEWQLRQGDDVLGTRPINIANFEENSEVPDGERLFRSRRCGRSR